MPQPLTTTFELGDRPLGRAWHAFAVFGQVAVARGDVHHFQHVFRVRFPVGGHVQDAAYLELAAHQLREGSLDDTALVVTGFVPRVGEEQHQAVEAVVGDAAVEHFNRVAVVDPQVGQALGQHAVKQRTDTWTVHFHTDEVLLRRGRRHLQQGMAHAETDFEGPRRRAAEYLVEIDRRISPRQHVQRRALVKEGFDVMVYTSDDPIIARQLAEIGCIAVMPLAGLIGTGLGICNPYNLQIILEEAKIPVLVDAGVGTASDATIAMELGCEAVLMNSAIANAQQPIMMAEAMKHAIVAGRLAYLAGRMPKKLYASASSPLDGLIK